MQTTSPATATLAAVARVIPDVGVAPELLLEPVGETYKVHVCEVPVELERLPPDPEALPEPLCELAELEVLALLVSIARAFVPQPVSATKAAKVRSGKVFSRCFNETASKPFKRVDPAVVVIPCILNPFIYFLGWSCVQRLPGYATPGNSARSFVMGCSDHPSEGDMGGSLFDGVDVAL